MSFVSIQYYYTDAADHLCKQFGQNVRPDLDPNHLTLMVFTKDFFENVNFEKNGRWQKKHASKGNLLKKEQQNDNNSDVGNVSINSHMLGYESKFVIDF